MEERAPARNPEPERADSGRPGVRRGEHVGCSSRGTLSMRRTHEDPVRARFAQAAITIYHSRGGRQTLATTWQGARTLRRMRVQRGR